MEKIAKQSKRSREKVNESKSKKRLKAETTTTTLKGKEIETDDNVRLYLGNLSVGLTTKECRAFFKDCGNIISIVFFEKKDKSFQKNGYIIFSTELAAQQALSMKGQVLSDKSIIIRMLGSRQTKSIHLSNLSFQLTEEVCWEFFADCGKIKDIFFIKNHGKNTGTGWITFATQKEADKAIAQSDTLVMNRPIIARYSLFSRGCPDVSIANISKHVVVNQIKTFFQDCGPVSRIRFVKQRSTGVFLEKAIVTFKNPGMVHNAVKKSGNMLAGVMVLVTYGNLRKRPVNGKTLFIENMPKNVTEGQVEHFFEDCGPISGVRLLNNRETSEAGFVTFKNPKVGIDKAMQKDGTDFMSRLIEISYSRDMVLDCKNVFVAHLHEKINRDVLKRFFSDCGEISSIRLKKAKIGKSRVAYIEFKNSQEADNAVKKNGASLLGEKIRVEYLAVKKIRCSKSVLVTNLPLGTDDELMKEIFGDCGEITRVRLISNKKTRQFKQKAYVHFRSTQAIDKALEKDDSRWCGFSICVESRDD